VVAVTVEAGQAIIIPANMIYLVLTVEESVVYAASFISEEHILQAAYAYQTERDDGVSLGTCFPAFDTLLHLSVLAGVYRHTNEPGALPFDVLRSLWTLLLLHATPERIEKVTKALLKTVSYTCDQVIRITLTHIISMLARTRVMFSDPCHLSRR
jgi:hypothetical protein